MNNKTISCEECENLNSILYCFQCEQYICIQCDGKIHNRGKRLKHQRDCILDQNSKYKFLLNYKRNKENKNIFYNSEDILVSVLTFFEYENIYSVLDLISISYLFEQAKNGKLMIELEIFIENIHNDLEKEGFKINKTKLKNYFLKENSSNFHFTKRIFGDIFNQIYISLKLKNFSLESIYWVLKSIKNDKMQSNDKLVMSRIKEYFSIKFNIKQWTNFCNFYNENLTINEKFEKYYCDSYIYLTQEENENNNDKSISINNNYSYIFKIKNEDWKYEDLIIIDEKNEPNNSDLKEFKNFMEDFFKENKNEDPKKNLIKWFSSVENSYTKTSMNTNLNLQKTLLSQGITKVIPGGKYGCALMIKSCGSSNLKKLSLGKICSLVQNSLNNQFLIYFKTLLIKNNNNSKNIEGEFENDKKEKIIILKNQIIKILKENKEIILAQLPQLLKKRFSSNYNIQNLGFPKLKALLITMEEIELEKTKNNFYNVRLKKEFLNKKNNTSKINNDRKFYTYKSSLNRNNKENELLEIQQKQNSRAFSNMEDYLNKIKLYILDILNSHRYGIELIKLQDILSNKMNSEFNPKIFKFDTFLEFLVIHLEEHIEIEYKIMNKKNKNSTHVVYLKHQRINKKVKNYLLTDSTQQLSEIRKNNFNESEYSEINEKTNLNRNISPDISLVNFNNLLKNENSYNNSMSKINNNDFYNNPNINIYSNFYKESSYFTNNSEQIKPINSNDNNSFNLNNIYFNNSISCNKKDQNSKLGFEYQVISPMPSVRNSVIQNEDIDIKSNFDDKENSLDEDSKENELRSIKFVENLLLDDLEEE